MQYRLGIKKVFSQLMFTAKIMSWSKAGRFMQTNSVVESRFAWAGAFICGLLLIATVIATPAQAAQNDTSRFNRPGNVLIADQFNNRVIEIDPKTHEIIWQFGDGSSVPGPGTIVGTNDAQRVGPLTLISGTGIPPATPALPGCPDNINGCPDNRVILVNPQGHIVWQYGQAGVAGSGPNQLNVPVQSTFLPNGHFLITDQSNERVIEVNRNHEIVWQYGTTGVAGSGFNQLTNPNSAELLANGHILISDENNNRAIEVTRDLAIVATFTAGGTGSGVAFSSRLNNGHTLITDSNNSRIVEVDASDAVVWQYFTNTEPGSNPTPLPTRAVRLRNGDTLISDQFNQRVIQVDSSGTIVFTQGMLNALGNGFNQLNGPYDAKVVGDYTGLTPPHGRFE
jgi:hypothetical protein